MEKIYLYIYDLPLCEITGGENLKVTHYHDNIEKARKEYPLSMRFYKQGIGGILMPIEDFISGLNRDDVKREASIEEDDDIFTKLYKVAGIELCPINGFELRLK